MPDDDLGLGQEPEIPEEGLEVGEPVEEQEPSTDTATAPVETPETATPAPVTVTLPAGFTSIDELLDYRNWQKEQETAKAAPAETPAAPAPLVDEMTIRYEIINTRYEKLAKQYEADNYAKPEIDTSYDKNESLWLEAMDDTKVMADTRVDAAVARALAEKQQQQATVSTTRAAIAAQIDALPPELAEVIGDLKADLPGADEQTLLQMAALPPGNLQAALTQLAKIALAEKIIAERRAGSVKPKAPEEPTMPGANGRQIGSTALKPLTDTQKTAYADAITQGYDKARADKIARAIA